MLPVTAPRWGSIQYRDYQAKWLSWLLWDKEVPGFSEWSARSEGKRGGYGRGQRDAW